MASTKPVTADFASTQPSEADYKLHTEWTAALASAAFQHFGLSDWKLVWDNHTKTRPATCNYGSRTIAMSTAFVSRCTADRIREVFLHQMTHALTGPAHHAHDISWKTAAQQVGCSAAEPCQAIQILRAPFVLTCSSRCFHRACMTRSWKTIETKRCAKCKNVLQFVNNNI